LSGEIGYQDVEGDKSTGNNLGMKGNDGYDYWHWRVGLAKEIPQWFTLALDYHNTDSDARDFLTTLPIPDWCSRYHGPFKTKGSCLERHDPLCKS
jgi:hypothetical protein